MKILMLVSAFCEIIFSQVLANVSETTEFAESENGMATSDFTVDFNNHDINDHLLTEIGRLVASIQSRPIVSQKLPPITQDSAGGSTIHLRLEYSILSLFGTDEMLQTVKTAMFLKLSWLNPALSWNSSEHLNITSLEFPSSIVWVPRVLLLNSVDLVDVVETFGKGLIVDNNGLVECDMPMFTETVCTMDLTRYPYDQQSCQLLFTVFSSYVRWLVEENNDTQQILNLTDLGTTWTLVKNKQLYIRQANNSDLGFSFFTDVMPRGLENVPNVMKLLLGVAIEGMFIALATIFILRRFHQEEKLRNSRSSFSKPVNMGNNNRVHPIVSSTNNIQGDCGTQGEKQETEEDEGEEEAAFAGGLTGAFTFSSQQLDRACFVVAVFANSVFLSYLFIDSLV
ncbi:hypothetical protein C0Q70_19078 [Pomacea canaliculata]|uniref:Neurotransmitter-gated ion-channel ligand-binding domain-containing protein n=1 Tax=Pomacea canaliculata TaxID=400727 RepID=A0A2T7NID4_POMCA|nr:hypothetical protein C0Q70_19078 [Pomacea canaliculata]